jgi:protein phosphatase
VRIQVVGQTNIGRTRKNNQDFILVDQMLSLFIVADGMGGHQGGEVASQIAVQTIQQIVKESFENDRGMSPYQLLQKAYLAASQAIFRKAQEEPQLKGMGTTAITGLIRDNILYVANVGDSRCYLIRHPYIWQMTEDHSLLNEQIRAGLVKPENAGQFAHKNVITRSVGFEEYVVSDIIERALSAGDKILMCTDGLSGMVDDRRISEVTLVMSFEDVVTRLIEEANGNGGLDNISVIYLQVLDD